MSRTVGWLIALLTLFAGCEAPEPTAPSAGASNGSLQMVVVLDGLRPDYVTPERMPALHALSRRGVVFTRHHAVFPTVTRVNSASIATGAYPEAHGLLGNTVYVPAVDAAASLSTSSKDVLDRMAATDAGLLTATSLGEALAAGGRTMVALSSGSEGSGLLLDHLGSGAVIHPDFTVPARLRARVDARLGAGPGPAASVVDRTRWLVDVFLEFALDELSPDVAILWLGDVDTAAHASGVGSSQTLRAIEAVDDALARLLAGLDDRGRLDQTNVIVTADHGFSSHDGGFDPGAAIARAGAPGDGSPVIRAGGAIHAGADADLVTRIVEELQRDPAVGAIFTRPATPGSPNGVVPGTLSLDLARWNHARAGDILVSAHWTDAENAHGFAGRSTNGGTAGHGSTSPFEIRAPLIVAGPSFRTGAVTETPTANVDIAPTLLHVLDVAAPSGMQGRVIAEALRGGPDAASMPITRAEHGAEVTLPGLTFSITAHTTSVGEWTYLDEVRVHRTTDAADR